MKAAPGMRDVSFSGVFESLRPLLPIGTRMSATRLWRRLVSMPELCENEPGSTASCVSAVSTFKIRIRHVKRETADFHS